MNLRNLLINIMFCAAVAASAQEAGPRLIVRADDMGSFRAANIACIEGVRNGIITDIEVMPVTSWFPEAARLLRENPQVDVGLHLTFTSEWDNIKWRPLTHCPSLCDENGYFLPMMSPNPAYPGLSIMENDIDMKEVEQEARAQIEMALRHIPQISHVTGHMGACRFSPEAAELMQKLSEEYNLPMMDAPGAQEKYGFEGTWYAGPKTTSAEKEASFIAMLEKLEPGRTYMFIDHPALDNEEMQTVSHIGYENVAIDRQGVTDIFTSEKVKQVIAERGISLIGYNDITKHLPRGTASPKLDKAFDKYLAAVKDSGQDLHSIMILKDGKVLKEKWLGEGAAGRTHILNSVSKTFTSMAVGFAVADGRLKVTDKVISFFPEYLPDEVSANLAKMEVRHLLTMTCGHDTDPTGNYIRTETPPENWVKAFLSVPVEHEPGTFFCYNSVGTYMLSAIVQKVTGEKVLDYLYPLLFRPLGIVGATWLESPQGINTGGWGLFLKTEDLAKMGQFILQKGEWNGKQLIPVSWIEDMSAAQVESLPAGARKEQIPAKAWKESDWLQGYGYQMWRCRNNAFRADGANGQYILILPEKNAVIAMTAHIQDMQAELNLVWKHLLKAL